MSLCILLLYKCIYGIHAVYRYQIHNRYMLIFNIVYDSYLLFVTSLRSWERNLQSRISPSVQAEQNKITIPQQLSQDTGNEENWLPKIPDLSPQNSECSFKICGSPPTRAV